MEKNSKSSKARSSNIAKKSVHLKKGERYLTTLQRKLIRKNAGINFIKTDSLAKDMDFIHNISSNTCKYGSELPFYDHRADMEKPGYGSNIFWRSGPDKKRKKRHRLVLCDRIKIDLPITNEDILSPTIPLGMYKSKMKQNNSNHRSNFQDMFASYENLVSAKRVPKACHSLQKQVHFSNNKPKHQGKEYLPDSPDVFVSSVSDAFSTTFDSSPWGSTSSSEYLNFSSSQLDDKLFCIESSEESDFPEELTDTDEQNQDENFPKTKGVLNNSKKNHDEKRRNMSKVDALRLDIEKQRRNNALLESQNRKLRKLLRIQRSNLGNSKEKTQEQFQVKGMIDVEDVSVESENNQHAEDYLLSEISPIVQYQNNYDANEFQSLLQDKVKRILHTERREIEEKLEKHLNEKISLIERNAEQFSNNTHTQLQEGLKAHATKEVTKLFEKEKDNLSNYITKENGNIRAPMTTQLMNLIDSETKSLIQKEKQVVVDEFDRVASELNERINKSLEVEEAKIKQNSEMLSLITKQREERENQNTSFLENVTNLKLGIEKFLSENKANFYEEVESATNHISKARKEFENETKLHLETLSQKKKDIENFLEEQKSNISYSLTRLQLQEESQSLDKNIAGRDSIFKPAGPESKRKLGQNADEAIMDGFNQISSYKSQAENFNAIRNGSNNKQEQLQKEIYNGKFLEPHSDFVNPGHNMDSTPDGVNNVFRTPESGSAYECKTTVTEAGQEQHHAKISGFTKEQNASKNKTGSDSNSDATSISNLSENENRQIDNQENIFQVEAISDALVGLSENENHEHNETTSAAIKFQKLFRGFQERQKIRSTRGKEAAAKVKISNTKWIKVYDSSLKQSYYYNATTGTIQWELSEEDSFSTSVLSLNGEADEIDNSFELSNGRDDETESLDVKTNEYASVRQNSVVSGDQMIDTNTLSCVNENTVGDVYEGKSVFQNSDNECIQIWGIEIGNEPEDVTDFWNLDLEINEDEISELDVQNESQNAITVPDQNREGKTNPEESTILNRRGLKVGLALNPVFYDKENVNYTGDTGKSKWANLGSRTTPTGKQVGEWAERIDAESGEIYYYNCITDECRWDPPPDFMRRAGLIKPKPSKSSWDQISTPSGKRLYWYNWATGKSQWEEPAEVATNPSHNGLEAIEEEVANTDNNSNPSETGLKKKTLAKRVRFTLPPTPKQEGAGYLQSQRLWDILRSTSMGIRKCDAWVLYRDEKSKEAFYHNTDSGSSQWEKPKEWSDSLAEAILDPQANNINGVSDKKQSFTDVSMAAVFATKLQSCTMKRTWSCIANPAGKCLFEFNWVSGDVRKSLNLAAKNVQPSRLYYLPNTGTDFKTKASDVHLWSILLDRSVKTRDLGEGWIEYLDETTGEVFSYKYDEINGEQYLWGNSSMDDQRTETYRNKTIDSQWKPIKSLEGGETYWYNSETRETSWEKPI